MVDRALPELIQLGAEAPQSLTEKELSDISRL